MLGAVVTYAFDSNTIKSRLQEIFSPIEYECFRDVNKVHFFGIIFSMTPGSAVKSENIVPRQMLGREIHSIRAYSTAQGALEAVISKEVSVGLFDQQGFIGSSPPQCIWDSSGVAQPPLSGGDVFDETDSPFSSHLRALFEEPASSIGLKDQASRSEMFSYLSTFGEKVRALLNPRDAALLQPYVICSTGIGVTPFLHIDREIAGLLTDDRSIVIGHSAVSHGFDDRSIFPGENVLLVPDELVHREQIVRFIIDKQARFLDPNDPGISADFDQAIKSCIDAPSIREAIFPIPKGYGYVIEGGLYGSVHCSATPWQILECPRLDLETIFDWNSDIAQLTKGARRVGGSVDFFIPAGPDFDTFTSSVTSSVNF